MRRYPLALTALAATLLALPAFAVDAPVPATATLAVTATLPTAAPVVVAATLPATLSDGHVVVAPPTTGFWAVPGTATSLQVYGFACFDAEDDLVQNGGGYLLGLSTANATPGTATTGVNFTPGADNANPKGNWNLTAAFSRFGINSITPTAWGDAKTKIEADFCQEAPTGSGFYTFNLRHAYGQIGGFLAGQTWSTFQDMDGEPDYIDWDGLLADYYGAVRYPQVRYTGNINATTSYAFAIEKDETNVGATANAPQQTPLTTHSLPGAAISWIKYADKWGHVQAGVAYQKYSMFTPASTSTLSKNSLSWSLSGNLNIGDDNLVIHVGRGTGQYGAGLQDTVVLTGNNTLSEIQALQTCVGYTHAWTKSVRSNVFGSDVRYSEDAATGMTGYKFHTMDQYGGNTIVKLGKNMQFGIEYIWGVAKTFDPNMIINPDGSKTDSIHESKIHLQSKFTF